MEDYYGRYTGKQIDELLGKAGTAIQPVEGKGLSSNDYTNEEKQKLSKLEVVKGSLYYNEELVDGTFEVNAEFVQGARSETGTTGNETNRVRCEFVIPDGEKLSVRTNNDVYIRYIVKNDGGWRKYPSSSNLVVQEYEIYGDGKSTYCFIFCNGTSGLSNLTPSETKSNTNIVVSGKEVQIDTNLDEEIFERKNRKINIKDGVFADAIIEDSDCNSTHADSVGYREIYVVVDDTLPVKIANKPNLITSLKKNAIEGNKEVVTYNDDCRRITFNGSIDTKLSASIFTAEIDVVKYRGSKLTGITMWKLPNGSSSTRFYVYKENGGTELLTAPNRVSSNNLSVFEVAIPSDATKIQFGFATWQTYSVGYEAKGFLWAGLYESDGLIIEDFSYSKSYDFSAIDTLYYSSVLTYLRKTKKYIDGKIKEVAIDPDSLDLHYVTPEQFGAKGDGVTDDSDAINNAVNAAIRKRVPFRAFGTYLTTKVIDLFNEGEYITDNYYIDDFYFNRIIYKGNEKAINIQMRYGIVININSIVSDGIGIEINSGLRGTKSLLLNLNRCSSINHCLYIHNYEENIQGVIVDPKITVGRLESESGNAIRFINCDCESVIEGRCSHLSVNEPNNALYFDRAGDITLRDFAFEGESYKAIFAKGVTLKCHNFRTRECGDRKRFNNQQGTIFEIVGDASIITENVYVDFGAIDNTQATDCKSIYNEHVNEKRGGKIFESIIGLDRMSCYNYLKGSNNEKLNVYWTRRFVNAEIYLYGNRKMIRYKNNSQFYWAIEDETFNIGDKNLVMPRPTIFDIKTNTEIKLDESYCSLAINEITVLQNNDNARCLIYDENDTLIFDGYQLGQGEYKVYFARRANITFPDGKQVNMYSPVIWDKELDEIKIQRMNYL